MPNVRYFHAGDSETATRVAAALAEAGTGAAVRDFTHLSPAPDSGTIEIWLSGEAPQVAATPQRSSVGSPSGGVLQIARPRGLLGRIFSAVSTDSPASSRNVPRGSGPIASFRAIAPSRGRTEATAGGGHRGFQSDAAGRSQSVSSRGDSSGRGSGATQRASAAGGSLTAGGSRTVSSSPDTGSSNSGAASVARSTSPASAGSRAPGGSGAAAGDDRGRGGSSSANAGPGGKSHGKSSAAGPGNNNAGGNGKSKGNSKGKGGGSAGAGKGGPGGGKGKSGGKKD